MEVRPNIQSQNLELELFNLKLTINRIIDRTMEVLNQTKELQEKIANIEQLPTKDEIDNVIDNAINNMELPPSVFKDGDPDKNIEIGLNHVVPETVTLDNSNVYIGGGYNGANRFDDKKNVIIGVGVLSNDEQNTCVRFSTKATSCYGVAIGSESTAAYGGVAVGMRASASASWSISIGMDVFNSITKSIAIGKSDYTKCKIGPNTLNLATGGITFNELPKMKVGLTPTDSNGLVSKGYIESNYYT
jgi:hypothetical protein